MNFFAGIRFKLALLISILVALITLTSLIIVINLMDSFILANFIQKGVSIGTNAAVSAGYSLLSDDRLALDNLSNKLRESQEDIIYVSAVDMNGVVKAHSEMTNFGKPFQEMEGTIIKTIGTGSTVKKGRLNGRSLFEFKVPILFIDKRIGYMYIAIDTNTLAATREEARTKITLVAIIVLFLGFVGTFFLSNFYTVPIKRLSSSVSLLSSGKFEHDILIRSNDEIGELTANFNEMARTIIKQKWRLEKDAKDLEDSYLSTVKLIAAAIDARCPRTLGHSTRVAKLSVLCGAKMGLSHDKLKDLELACLFHDVGKIRIPDHVLHKEGHLSDDEKMLVKKHPSYGAEILELSESLHKHIPAVLYHHEWYNGEGYPEGLQGSTIPLFASIIAIADAYDAMTSFRPYKYAKSKEEAIRELKKFRGQQFSPKITDIFINVLKTYEDNTQKLLSTYDSDHVFMINDQ